MDALQLGLPIGRAIQNAIGRPSRFALRFRPQAPEAEYILAGALVVLALQIVGTDCGALWAGSPIWDLVTMSTVHKVSEFKVESVLQGADPRATISLVGRHGSIVPDIVTEEAEYALTQMTLLPWVHGFVDHQCPATTDLDIHIPQKLHRVAVCHSKWLKGLFCDDRFYGSYKPALGALEA